MKRIITTAVLVCLVCAQPTYADSKVFRLEIGDEIIPCQFGGRVVAIRESTTGLRLVREPRPPRYIRRINPLLNALRDWELDRRDVMDRGGVRFLAHWPRGELSNWTSTTIVVRLVCDRRRS
jgi:hypothetical protein